MISGLVSAAKSMKRWCLGFIIIIILSISTKTASENVTSSSSSSSVSEQEEHQDALNVTYQPAGELPSMSYDFSDVSNLVFNLSTSSENDDTVVTYWNDTMSLNNSLIDVDDVMHDELEKNSTIVRDKNSSFGTESTIFDPGQQWTTSKLFIGLEETLSSNNDQLINTSDAPIKPISNPDRGTFLDGSGELYVRLLQFVFLFLAFVVVACAFHVCIRRRPTRVYALLIHFFLLSLSLTRALVLFLVPTSVFSPSLPSDSINHLWLLLFNFPFPCLLASFTLIFIAFLHLTQVRPFTSSTQTSYYLLVLISLQFFSVLLLDLFFNFFIEPNKISVSQLTFSLWFWLFAAIFFYYFRQLRFIALRKQSEIIRFTFTKLHIEGGPLPPKLPYSPLGVVMNLLFICVVLILLLTFLLIFNIILESGVIGEQWVIKFKNIIGMICRVWEIVVSFSLLYIAIQPLDTAESKSVFSVFSNCACSDTCDDKRTLGDNIYPAYCASNSAVARTQFTFERWDSSNRYCSQHAFINNVSSGVRKHSETLRSCAQPETRSIVGNRRQVTLATLATLSDVHSHPPSMLFNENGFIRFRNNSDPEQETVAPGTPRRSPGRNLFNTITLKRSNSSDGNGFDVHLQRASSTTKTEELTRRRSGGSTPAKEGRKIPNLNLTSTPATKPPQDITPDSAVYLELPSDDVVGCPQLLSQSMNDLQAGCFSFTPKHKGLSRSLLSRLRSSSFSLSSHHGYEQLGSPQSNFHRHWEMKTAFRESGASSRLSREVNPDSVYDSDDQSSHFSSHLGRFNSVTYVSTEVQTDPTDFITHQMVVSSNESKV